MRADVHLCVPVLKRYDHLRQMLISLQGSTRMPAILHVIDNGHDPARLQLALSSVPDGMKVDVYTPLERMGVAEAWNWFIHQVPEERIITNDDVIFSPNSVEDMVAAEGMIVSPLMYAGNAFSCFLIRNHCIEKIGLFDETISPGYAYFEDCDYEERLFRENINITDVNCGVEHRKSQTIAAFSPSEMNDHHTRFLAAQNRFVAKWGRLPRGM